ncbi:MAG: NifB/NifX family molybdenum-iron cluster-binding protein [Leptotrichiaceae bacterium]|jgi:predicted Fe-Mo cluster-binding NifX family protein|nr:NifB/NifX family molybdenum-iron cluster-binding protein [Leptotrichiaceae bacterium]MBP9595442.1 NifB/NifX family molybdenum-iron cluster-binding protein [Fusobacteriaceae bacterium]MBU9917944.1 NifB/NifX family molybdenum-iron cluster-binding protein [Fusobacteriaceae bacterium]
MLKIAFPTNDRKTVEEHFGHCSEFVIYNVENGKILNSEFIVPPPHAPGVIPNFLGQFGIHTIITGGMGQMAINIFKENNIEVILGATGSIEETLEVYLGGELESTGSACSHHHGDDHDHDHGHNCGN